MRLHELKTPCAVVDLEKLKRNAAWGRHRAAHLGVVLRPHVKTHKCAEIARIQMEGLPGRLTVSTLAEARAMVGAGFRDLTWAVPIPLPRLGEALDLIASLDRFSLLADHADAVSSVEEDARRRGVRVPLFLKVDCGFGRAGVDPRAPASKSLALRMSGSTWLEFRGLMTHAGQAYLAETREAAAEVAHLEREAVTEFAEILRREGIEVPEVSVGSTPTFAGADDLTGVTEARPGNYIFFDAFQAAIGACGIADCAFGVVASVVGAYPESGRYLLDAGALALSKDPGAIHVDPRCGYGRLADLRGEEIPGLRLAALTQEHGHVSVVGECARELRVGERVRILPNHACLAAACFDRYCVIQGEEVVDTWGVARGW